MPVYSYRCKFCLTEFIVNHSINEVKKECISCGEKDGLQLQVSSFSVPGSAAASKTNPKVGSVVRKHIEEAKQEVQKLKEEMRKRSSEEYKV